MPVKVMLMIRRKAELSPEAFRTAYEERHAPLASRLFGHLWLEYRRNYLGLANRFAREAGTPTTEAAAEASPPYDVVTEMVFRDRASLEEMNRIAIQAENARLLAEDEATLFDRENCWTCVCDVAETDPAETPPPSPTVAFSTSRSRNT